MNRRTFLVLLLGGFLSTKTAFSFAGTTGEKGPDLNEISLHLLGIEDQKVDISSKLKKSGRFRVYKDFLRHISIKYQKTDGFDYKAFLIDLDSKKAGSGSFDVMNADILKNEAIKAFYTTKEGWAIAGYEGPPLSGYMDYYVCRQ